MCGERMHRRSQRRSWPTSRLETREYFHLALQICEAVVTWAMPMTGPLKSVVQVSLKTPPLVAVETQPFHRGQVG